jgi:hypothetical protein
METLADLAGWVQTTDVSAIVRIHKSYMHRVAAILDQGIVASRSRTSTPSKRRARSCARRSVRRSASAGCASVPQ